MRFLPWVPPAISPQAKTPFERRLGARSIDEPAVLVVEDGVREIGSASGSIPAPR